MEIISRKEAAALGQKRYFTGQTCRAGHVAEYYVSSGCCSVCAGNNSTAQRLSGANVVSINRWRAAHSEKIKQYRRNQRGQRDAPNRPSFNVCECCARFMEGRSQHEDHDHVTGYFRGWLCGRCNSAIGLLGDTVAGVQKAVDYLIATAKYNERVRN
jgi:hypothetical protein